ncbi:MAG: hypothetical protein IJA20_02665 [Methanocorpusculum sp.]|nr:hypothetical protein [Methanocorpusculum sp.]
MARNTVNPVQQYRGTTDQHAGYTGAVGEVTVDITKMTAVVQDGVTAGGHPLAKESRKVTADGTIVQVNGGAEGTLAQDVTIGLSITGLVPALVSTDVNNGLSVGTDGKLTVGNAAALVKANDELLSLDGDGKIQANIDLAYDTTSGKLDLIGQDGVTVVGTVTIPSSISMLENVALAVNPVDPDGDGSATLTGTYLDFDFRLADGSAKQILVNVTDLIDVYTAGDGVKVEGKVISLKLAATGNNAKIDDSGNLIVPSDYGTMD